MTVSETYQLEQEVNKLKDKLEEIKEYNSIWLNDLNIERMVEYKE